MVIQLLGELCVACSWIEEWWLLIGMKSGISILRKGLLFHSISYKSEDFLGTGAFL